MWPQNSNGEDVNKNLSNVTNAQLKTKIDVSELFYQMALLNFYQLWFCAHCILWKLMSATVYCITKHNLLEYFLYFPRNLRLRWSPQVINCHPKPNILVTVFFSQIIRKFLQSRWIWHQLFHRQGPSSYSLLSRNFSSVERCKELKHFEKW